ncbi:hypothetical protein ACFYXH_35505 [Streptomyces sp. NPDC002730]|nr:hypothetical protein OG735_09235 [Streptomyces sp. NBC_01210]
MRLPRRWDNRPGPPQAEGDRTMTDVHPTFRLDLGGEEQEPRL